MTGDGLQDIVLVHDGSVEYWPNVGHGDWAKPVQMMNCPRFPWGYDPRRILVGDIDGDGLADLVYVDDRKVTLWINRSGSAWSDPIVVTGTPPVSDMDAVRLVDLRGSGVAGVLWSADANGRSRTQMFFLDFTGGRKPYLLDEMDNHLGAVTKVEYAPSTRFYLEDERRPATRWKTPLPFPVQVVAKVEAIDQISGGKLTTEYRYHHGYWDGAEREFRGFGMVEQLDTETFEAFHEPGLHREGPGFEAITPAQFSPPTLTKTWFYQGPIGDELGDWEEPDFGDEFWTGDRPVLTRPQQVTELIDSLPRRVKRDALRALRGTVLRTELYALDGTDRQDLPYTVTESLAGVCGVADIDGRPRLLRTREELPPEWTQDDTARRIFFPHTLTQRTTQWERSEEPLIQFTFTDDYDDYGQPTSQVSIGVPRWRRTELGPLAARPSDALPAGTPAHIRQHEVSKEQYLVTLAVTDRAQRDTDACFIVDRVARTTTYAIANTGREGLFALVEAIETGVAAREVIGQTLNFFDGPAFQGLPFAELGEYGALVRTETLILTKERLRNAYRSGDKVLSPPEAPPYLTTDGAPAWPAEYPGDFRTATPALAGYVYQPGGADSPYQSGFFAESERRKYDSHDPDGRRRGLVIITRDPLGRNPGERETTFTYDSYDLLPTSITDPAGLVIAATYDYRVFQPDAVTDLNGNRRRFIFSPLGLLAGSFVSGREGASEGDVDRPSARLEYDFHAFSRDGGPISVRTIRHVYHDSQRDVPLPVRDETIETREYSDGLGRLLQTRTQAEDVVFGDPVFGNLDAALPRADLTGQPVSGSGPRVVVSGWQTYDNKGRVVEKYEPFFAEGWAYAPPSDAHLAGSRKALLYYDPRGRVIRTVSPDRSEQRVVYGVPADPADPDQFAPLPWETYTYDANDNAGRTHAEESRRYATHWNTPASAVVDALGRTIEAVVGNGADPDDWYHTRSTYDIRGNLLTVTDELDRLAFQYVYDLANRPLRVEQLDAGVRRTVLDAAGNALEQRDAKGALLLHAYDVLNRPTRLWACDNSVETVVLRGRSIYGDAQEAGLSRTQAAERNLLGKLYRQYDEAGVLTVEAYDFKGNVLERVRQVVRDDQILAVFDAAPAHQWQVAAFRVDWQPAVGETPEERAKSIIDQIEYRTSFTYDALNRVTSMLYPADTAGVRKTLLPSYNRAGALESVSLDGVTYAERIANNAKGQRTLISYGNGVMTRYAYEPLTFRLARLRTEGYTRPVPLAYRPAGPVLQDCTYAYDLVGNILDLHDRTPGSGHPSAPTGPDALDRAFVYDPIYRLHSATGRECDAPPPLPWDSAPRCTDLTRARGYVETYCYDRAGNLRQLQHTAGSGSFTRQITLAEQSNRLAGVTVGATAYAYTYDDGGNLTGETTSRHFEWDHSDRLRIYRTQTGGAEPSVHAHYLYDAGGQRVKQLVRKQSGHVEVTVYVDGLFEHRRLVYGGAKLENCTLHVMDDQRRIALIRLGEPFPDDKGPAVQYQLGDHLDSSNVVLDAAGALVNREEYTPYGETSFGSFARKRYRFTGKERDEESGLSNHGARYYAPWLARWVSCDPAHGADGFNLYGYASDNPLTEVDHTGHSGSASQLETGASKGKQAMDQIVHMLEEKGHGVQTEVTTKGGPGGSRHDITPDPKARQTISRTIEVKYMDLSSDSYRTNLDGLDEGALKSAIRKDLDQVEKHMESLRRGVKPDLPFKESLVYSVENAASPEGVKEFRRIFREEARPRGIRGGAIEFRVPDAKALVESGAETVKSAKFAPSAKAAGEALEIAVEKGSKTVLKTLGQKALKVVPGVGIASGIYSMQQEWRQGNYGAAVLEGVGLVPVVGDLVDAARLGWAVGSVANEWIDAKVQAGSGSVGDWYYRTFLK